MKGKLLARGGGLEGGDKHTGGGKGVLRGRKIERKKVFIGRRRGGTDRGNFQRSSVPRGWEYCKGNNGPARFRSKGGEKPLRKREIMRRGFVLCKGVREMY